VPRLADGRASAPTAAIFDGRTLHSSPESGAQSGDDVIARPPVDCSCPRHKVLETPASTT